MRQPPQATSAPPKIVRIPSEIIKAYEPGVKTQAVEMALTRQTICFSKREVMHDTVIGLLINKVKFKRDIHAKSQI